MSWFFKPILLSLVFLIPTAATDNYWQLDHMEYNLAKCLVQLIIDEQFNHTRNIRISVKTETGRARFIPGDLIDQIRGTRGLGFQTFEYMPKSLAKRAFYEIHCRLILIDSYKSFKELLQLQRKNSFDINGLNQYYYIMLTHYQEDTSTVEKILDLCLQNYIINVNLIVEDSEGTNIVYTYFPFTENSCRKSTATIYNRCVDGKLQWNRPVFPNKIKNLWMCPVKAVTWHKPPFVFLEDQQISGIDGNFLIFLSKVMNFTLDVFESPNGIGEVLSNGTMRGAFKIMQDREGDLMVGGTICSKPRRAHLACSRDYMTTSLKIIVKKPNPYSSFEVLLFPFEKQTWSILFVFLIINLTIRVLWRKFTFYVNGNGILSTRLQIISWLLSIFIIRSSYEGSIFQFLHNQPIRRVPQNFEGLLANGYKFLAKSTYLPLVKPIPVLMDKLILAEISLSRIFDEFDQYNGKYALINLDNYLTVIANDSTRYGHYLEIREPILHNIVCVYLPKFSFLTTELNSLIEMMFNHGHTQKVYQISVTDKLRKIKSTQGSAVNTIPFNEVIGAFQLLFILIAVGIFCLLMECLAGKNRMLKKVVDFLH